jgi:hypothetical protein
MASGRAVAQEFVPVPHPVANSLTASHTFRYANFTILYYGQCYNETLKFGEVPRSPWGGSRGFFVGAPNGLLRRAYCSTV